MFELLCSELELGCSELQAKRLENGTYPATLDRTSHIEKWVWRPIQEPRQSFFRISRRAQQLPGPAKN